VILVSIEQHAKVVEAIERGSQADAEGAMRTHLRQILQDLPYVAEQKPEFFDGSPDQFQPSEIRERD